MDKFGDQEGDVVMSPQQAWRLIYKRKGNMKVKELFFADSFIIIHSLFSFEKW